MTSKIITGAVVIAALLGAIAFFGFSPFLKTVVESFGTTSGTGTTQHLATFAFNPTVAAATSSSIQNTDAQDRVVTSADVACSGTGTSKTAYTGTGLANLTVQIATTSASAPAALGNTNYVLNVNISTSTTDTYVATSSTNVVNSATGNAIRWPASSYMTISSNATNTAACVVGIRYMQGLGF